MSPAPYQSCVVCYRGDTTTAVVIQGVAEFHIFFLMRKLGLPEDEAAGTVRACAHYELGHDLGTVPVGQYTVAVRLCRQCAEFFDVQIGELGGKLPGYAQPL